MSITIERHATCDGCGKTIENFESMLYKVVLLDQSTIINTLNLTFHTYDCVCLWAKRKEIERQSKLTLAAAHVDLHDALDTRGIDLDTYQTSLTPEGEAGEALESYDLKATRKAITEVNAGKLDDLKQEEPTDG